MANDRYTQYEPFFGKWRVSKKIGADAYTMDAATAADVAVQYCS